MMVIAAVQNLAAVQRAEEKFRGLLEFSPDAMAIFDKDGKIALVNAPTALLVALDQS
jgi:PAS domain-containing protein